MIRMSKMGAKAKICVTAIVVAAAALALFCGKSKTKETEDAAVKNGDTSAVAVEGGDTSAATVENDAYSKFMNAFNVSDSERLDPKKYKNEKDYLKALDSARSARLDIRKILFDSVKADFFKRLDFEQDLSGLKMNELLYLRSSIYAVKGLYFKEENINSYFLRTNKNIPWYSDYMCFLLEYAHQKKGTGFVENEKDVKLNDTEKRFIARIDKRISELRKDGMYVSKNGNTVGDVAHIVNMHKIRNHIYDGTDFMDKLTQNNFVISVDNLTQLFHIYEKNDYARMPSFVTTDLFLQAFHMYLSYMLKKLESREFLPALEDLCMGLYKASMKLSKSENVELAQIAEYNATFYAIAYTLFTGGDGDMDVPEKYQKDYDTEIKYATEARADGVNSAFLASLAPQGEPMLMQYSLFKPRGYYTRHPEMKNYFRGMMWLQNAFACRNREAHLKQSIFTAILLNGDAMSHNKLIDRYASVFEPTAMLVGEPNNLSIMDIALFLQKEHINDMSSALSAENVEKVDNLLKSLAERIIIKPKIRETCADKINFMPQRYLIDNEVLQESVDLDKRPFPKGLDVFNAFGSTTAGDVLNNFYKEGEKWGDYTQKTAKLQKRFKNFDGWNKSTYNKWIESLLTLQKRDKSYPAFMKTGAWDYKNLNTSLASWAELKHDFALYGEQPNAAESGGDCDDFSFNLPEPDVEVGYVEPNILFWNKLDELITSTKNVLVKHGLFDDVLKEKTKTLQEEVSFLIGVTKKELAKTPLNQEEYTRIKKIGGKIDYFTLNVLDPDISYPMWEYVTIPDTSIAVVADIYTGKNGILHVATGRANTIYVVVEINGYLYITRGATFSYYEFVMPPSNRLTDEKWQAMEAGAECPAIQEWMRSVISYDESYPGVYDDVHPVECFWRDGQCFDNGWERDL